MTEHKFLKIKNDFILKGTIPLEQLFDINDVPMKLAVLPKHVNTEE
jgi:hypothetical protein